jgi:hypothetical protein
VNKVQLVQVCYCFLILCLLRISLQISNFLSNIVGHQGDKGQKGQQGQQGSKGFQGGQGPVVSR